MSLSPAARAGQKPNRLPKVRPSGTARKNYSLRLPRPAPGQRDQRELPTTGHLRLLLPPRREFALFTRASTNKRTAET